MKSIEERIEIAEKALTEKWLPLLNQIRKIEDEVHQTCPFCQAYDCKNCPMSQPVVNESIVCCGPDMKFTRVGKCFEALNKAVESISNVYHAIESYRYKLILEQEKTKGNQFCHFKDKCEYFGTKDCNEECGIYVEYEFKRIDKRKEKK